MKIAALILGVVFAVLGVCLTGYSWYAAAANHHIIDGLAYSGPFFVIVGAWRILASGMATPPSLLRIVAVVLGIGAGYGNQQVLKAIYPGDQVISSSPSTPSNN
jgi:hypothetical protein